MDLLGSILGSMEKPPGMGEEEKKKAKAQKALMEKQQNAQKKKLQEFETKIRQRIHEYMKDGKQEKLKLEPMDKVYRAIVHEVADVAGLTSFSFGIEEEDRYVMIWKKEFAPQDDELLAYRKGEEWDPGKAKDLQKQQELQKLQEEEEAKLRKRKIIPNSDYKDKYKHLIGDEAAKDAARLTIANKAYGFVPSENKRDHRTIEQVLADSRAKKKQKTGEDQDASSADAETGKTSSS